MLVHGHLQIQQVEYAAAVAAAAADMLQG